MKKDRFGKSKGPLSKEEIEREAQKELERLSRGAGPRPTFTPPGGPPTALDEVADSVRGRSAAAPQPFRPPPPDLGAGPMGMPAFGGVPGRRGAPPPSLEPDAPFYDDDEAAADEAANVTEIALRDHAARFGSDPEDMVIRQDPFAAEMMRDQAMRQFFEQQEAKQQKTSRKAPADPVTSVLNRLAARKKAEEEILAQGDDGSGQTVLDRIRARREALVADVEPPPPSPLRGGPSRRGHGGRPKMTMIDQDDEDDEDDEDSPLAIMRARAEARRPPRPAPRRRVVALPGTELDQDGELDDDQDARVENDFEFEDEDEATQESDELDEYDGLAEDADDDGVEAPGAPAFEDVVARMSRMSRPKPPPATKRTARPPVSRPAPRSANSAPKSKAKPSAAKSSAATSRPASVPTAKSPAAKSSPAKVPAARRSAAKVPAARRSAAEVPAAKVPAARRSAAEVPAAKVPAGRRSATGAATKPAAKPAPSRGRVTEAPAPRTRRVATATKAEPATTAEPAPPAAVSDAAARKAAIKAKIAAAAKRAQSTR